MPYCKNCGSELPEGATFCPKCGVAVEGVERLRLAVWAERFVAWLIDIVILSLFLVPLRITWLASWPNLTIFPWAAGWIPFVDLGFSNVVYFVYWLYMESVYGQSIGKMIMRIKVTGLNGERADFVQVAIESIGKAFLLLLDLIIGWILYPRRRQRLLNHLSQTVVIRA
jgi:uncharacterized RDD family membrane protein YckC